MGSCTNRSLQLQELPNGTLIYASGYGFLCIIETTYSKRREGRYETIVLNELGIIDCYPTHVRNYDYGYMSDTSFAIGIEELGDGPHTIWKLVC